MAAASPWRISAAMLSAASAQISGAPARGRGDEVDDRRQLLVVDHDRLGRVARLLARLGDHRGHRLADEAHDLVRQRAARRA